jgi:hypothetical protein
MTYCPYCQKFTDPSHCKFARCGGFVCGTCGRCNREERFHEVSAGETAARPAARSVPSFTDAMLTLAATCAVLAGCAKSMVVVAKHHKVPAPVVLTTLAACQRLRADMTRDGGTPDKPTLLWISAHAASTRIAGEARQAAADVGDTSLLFSPSLALITYDCGQQGVQLP